jgi:hypothetical protein
VATVEHWGYFIQHAPGIPPQQARNYVWGPSSRYNNGTCTVTGHPLTELRNTSYYMWVSDMSIGARDIGVGDISNIQKTLHATFFNSGNPGDGTIHRWNVGVTKVSP